MKYTQIAFVKVLTSILITILFCYTSYGQEKVGIGTTTPTQRLSVNGKIEIGNDMNSPTEGAIKWDGSDFLGYNGSEWLSLTNGGIDDQIVAYTATDADTTFMEYSSWTQSDTSGVIYDSGGPLGNYGNNENVTFKISQNSAYLFTRVIVVELETEEDIDVLTISDEQKSFQFSGSSSFPDTLFFDANQLLTFTFISNGSNAMPYDGYKIIWNRIAGPLDFDEVPNITGFYYNPKKISIGGGANIDESWATDSLGFNSINLGFGANAKGQNSITIGNKARALYGEGISIGQYSEASGFYNSMAFGKNAQATQNHTIAIGGFSQATESDAISIGEYARSSDVSGVAIGSGALTLGQRGVSLGRAVSSNSDYGVAIGGLARADGEYGISLGGETSTYADGGIAIGQEAVTILSNGIAIGSISKSNGLQSIALGYNSISDGMNSIAFGNYANTGTNAPNSISIGYGASTLTSGNIAIGEDASANNTNAISIGWNAIADSTQSVSVGGYSSALGYRSTAFGDNANALGGESLALGFGAQAEEKHAVSLGSDSRAKEKAIAIGNSSNAFALGSISVGDDSGATKSGNIAIGKDAKSLYKNSIVIGDGASVSDSNCVVIGNKYYEISTLAYIPAKTYGANAISIGAGNIAYNNSVSIGASTISSATGVTVGFNSYADSLSVAYGTSSSTVGNGSVSLGYSAAVLSDSSIAIGYDSHVFAQNSIAIGAGVEVDNDNYVKIGNDNITTIGGAVDWSVISDGRFKVNVVENVPGLSFIKKLRPVTYNLDKGKKAQHTGGSGSGLTSIQTGFIAQEVEQAAIDNHYEFSAIHSPQSEKDHYTLSYAQFVVPLVKAVQELDEENKMLKAELKKMHEFQSFVMERIENLENEKGVVSEMTEED